MYSRELDHEFKNQNIVLTGQEPMRVYYELGHQAGVRISHAREADVEPIETAFKQILPVLQANRAANQQTYVSCGEAM